MPDIEPQPVPKAGAAGGASVVQRLPTAGAFHPVNAVLILGVTYSLFRRDLRAVSSQRAAVQP